MTMNTVTRAPNMADVACLLEACDLPASDITPEHMEHFFACRDGSDLTGVIGLELYGDAALLRSLAVASEYRGTGLGKQLVAQAEAYALGHGVQAIYLLTTTADKFFASLGYAPLSRDEAPAAIQSTTEYSSLCPVSSVFMVKRLGGIGASSESTITFTM